MNTLLHRLSISRKVSLVLWGVCFLVLGCGTVGVAIYESGKLEGQARERLEPIAELIEVGTGVAIQLSQRLVVEEYLETLRANPEIVEAHVLSGRGEVLGSYSASGKIRSMERRAAGVYFEGGEVLLVKELHSGLGGHQEVVGVLHLVMRRAPLVRQARQTLLVLGVVMLAVMAGTSVQVLLLKRSVTRPIAALVRVAETVREGGTFEQRVPAMAGDEVGRLGERFNEMLAAVQQRDAALQELNRFHRAILDNAAYAIVSTNAAGIVTSYNPAAERMLGYRASEVVGLMTPVRWHDQGELDRRAEALTVELGETVATGFEALVARAKRDLPSEDEWTFVCKDGRRLPVRLSTSALRGVGGQVTGYMGIASDMSERRRIEDEREKLIQELEAKNSELERFTYTVSHDLKSPLITVKGFAGALLKDLAAGRMHRVEPDLRRISDAADRMAQLLGNLLELSRVGRIANPPRQMVLGGLVAQVLELLSGPISQRGVEIVVQPGLPVVVADQQRILQVFQNLVENALKFMGDQAKPLIEIGARPAPGGPVLFVRDNGVGIDPRYRETVFGLFNKLDAKSPGTGIGLALVRRIIEVHGGRIWVESDGPGCGSTFCFTLPTGRAEESP